LHLRLDVRAQRLAELRRDKHRCHVLFLWVREHRHSRNELRRDVVEGEAATEHIQRDKLTHRSTFLALQKEVGHVLGLCELERAILERSVDRCDVGMNDLDSGVLDDRLRERRELLEDDHQRLGHIASSHFSSWAHWRRRSTA
jgi:hypothetical protein